MAGLRTFGRDIIRLNCALVQTSYDNNEVTFLLLLVLFISSRNVSYPTCIYQTADPGQLIKMTLLVSLGTNKKCSVLKLGNGNYFSREITRLVYISGHNWSSF